MHILSHHPAPTVFSSRLTHAFRFRLYTQEQFSSFNCFGGKSVMFSKISFFGVAATVMFALFAIVPLSAQFMNPTVDDVLDNPSEYLNKEVTLEGEVDRVYSDRTFAMEDDADVFGEDHILIISVMPTVAVANLDDNDMEVTNINDLKEGKLVRASGVVRMFDRAALETEFGTLSVGELPANFDSSRPVLILGAREYLASKVVTEEEELVAELPEPVAPEIETDTAPDMEPVEPEPVEPVEEAAPVEEEPVMEQDTPADTTETEELPRTATGLPLVGLIGFFSTALGLALRRR
jgi:hypothetical protein